VVIINMSCMRGKAGGVATWRVLTWWARAYLRSLSVFGGRRLVSWGCPSAGSGRELLAGGAPRRRTAGGARAAAPGALRPGRAGPRTRPSVGAVAALWRRARSMARAFRGARARVSRKCVLGGAPRALRGGAGRALAGRAEWVGAAPPGRIARGLRRHAAVSRGPGERALVRRQAAVERQVRGSADGVRAPAGALLRVRPRAGGARWTRRTPCCAAGCASTGRRAARTRR
jgi:hypothetical protein